MLDIFNVINKLKTTIITTKDVRNHELTGYHNFYYKNTFNFSFCDGSTLVFDKYLEIPIFVANNHPLICLLL